ncbi:unnamed protein product [Chironomus riparius]|uniref:Uncharacterized protein n=1 Tax=Chironomus riparius TaxID=315576 RepID=A0A9N9S9G1_9DIPT|nr:unnamed protein product [Chironomus riparius]
MSIKLHFKLQISGILLCLIFTVHADTPDNNSSFSIIDWLAEQLSIWISGVSSFAQRETIKIADFDCKYKCKDLNKSPNLKTNYVTSSNGCGSAITIPSFMVPVSLENCCNEHDKCYDTCNRSKENCDDEFQECLNKICGFELSVLDNLCKSIFPTIVAVAGCSEYLNAQDNACICELN